MPAFVDPDVALITRPQKHKNLCAAVDHDCDECRAQRLQLVSKHRLESTAAEVAANWVRGGVLSVGAHTGGAASPRESLRILRTHQGLHARPLRIRSVFRPFMPEVKNTSTWEAEGTTVANQIRKSLEVVRKRNLAGIAEFTLTSSNTELVRKAAVSASEAGYSIRIRIRQEAERELLVLALGLSSMAVMTPPVATVGGLRTLVELGNLGCVHVLGAGEYMTGDCAGRTEIRREIDEGVPVALAAAGEAGGVRSMNPQFMLYRAVHGCGMSAEEAIVASTYNAACALKMSHVTGSLEPGKVADLVVMDVDDYRDLIQRVGHNDVQKTIRAGHIVYRRGSLTVD